MAFRVFGQKINASQIFSLQKFQYSEKLIMSDTVPAASSKLGKVSVSNLGHFLCNLITGTYQTLYAYSSDPATDKIDDGVCHLRGQLTDGAGQKKLFNDYIPFNLFLSPGREKTYNSDNFVAPIVVSSTVTIALAAPAPQLFYPNEFEYLFSANSEIQLDVKNDSNAALSYNLVFHGIRILSDSAVSGLR